jgi:hypothetical protein
MQQTILLNVTMTSTKLRTDFASMCRARARLCGGGGGGGGQSSWLNIQKSRVRFKVLPNFLSSSGDEMGGTCGKNGREEERV